MPCGSRHQLTPPWGPVSLAAAFSPLSSLASGLPCSWADAGRGRAPPAPGSWRLTPQSHRANKSSQCPLPPGSLSVLALQAALAGASPPFSQFPYPPKPGGGAAGLEQQEFPGLLPAVPVLEAGSSQGAFLAAEDTQLPAPDQGTFQITTDHKKSSSAPCAVTRLQFRGPRSGSTEPTRSVVWWGLCLQE